MTIIQKSQSSLEYDKILAELSNYAKTEQSKKLCLDLTPYVSKEDIEREILYTKEAKAILDYARDIPVDRIIDFKKLREKNEYFIESELIESAKTLQIFRVVKNFLKENLVFDSILKSLSDGIYTNKELEDKK